MKDIQAIFFDFDGVILESVDVKGWAFGELFKSYPEYVEEITAFHYANGGMSRFVKFRYIYKNILKIPLSKDKFNSLCKNFSNLVYHRVVSCEFVPGAYEFLSKHNKQISFFIVSGTPQGEIEKIVRARDLAKFFLGVYGSPTSKNAWTKMLIKKFKLDIKKVIFVGDAMSDYNAAKSNGIYFIARINHSSPDIFKGKDIGTKIENLYDLDNFIKGYIHEI